MSTPDPVTPAPVEPGKRARLSLRRILIAGLLIWVPLGVTILTFKFLLDLFDQILLLLPPEWRPEQLIGYRVPGLGFVFAVLVILFTGVLARNFIGRRLVLWWEELVNRIPIVRSVYSGLRGFTETLFTSKSGSFRKVVIVEYPRREMWSIGFVTANDVPSITEKVGGERQVCVYLPTTPVPTSGFIVMVPASQVIEIDMSVDAAMRMIITLGVVVPTPNDVAAKQRP